MFKRRKKQKGKIKYETQEKTMAEVFEKAKKSSDFTTIFPLETIPQLSFSYYKTLIDSKLIYELLLPSIIERHEFIEELVSFKSLIPIEDIRISSDGPEVEKYLLEGYVAVQIDDNKQECALINTRNSKLGKRKNNETENEFSVIGPKTGFIEDLNVNLHLIRNELVTSDLIFEKFVVGTRSKSKVVVAYLDGVTNPEYVNTVRQRISSLNIDVLLDNAHLIQMISDHASTPFPLFVLTERVDRAVLSLITGRVALIVDNSCYVVTGPSNLMEFFSTPEDYYLPWLIATGLKLIRIAGMLFSIFSTSFYVAITTYHFEVIPRDLLGPIIYSMANVPFPPVIEVLFLEITIEFLREAGVRLPMKIGQTLGVVGGIVIGQATVEAALTSTILLIVVALSALSSFTTPIYKMSNAVRFLRYPFILLAAFWGGFGIFLGIAFLLGHLMLLKSLGNPYLVPLYPFRKSAILKSFSRPRFTLLKKRPSFLRPLSETRYEPANNQEPDEGLNSE